MSANKKQSTKTENNIHDARDRLSPTFVVPSFVRKEMVAIIICENVPPAESLILFHLLKNIFSYHGILKNTAVYATFWILAKGPITRSN